MGTQRSRSRSSLDSDAIGLKAAVGLKNVSGQSPLSFRDNQRIFFACGQNQTADFFSAYEFRMQNQLAFP
jgi:hypothetical protein